ncbi:MAG: hypothetical protein M3Y18_07940, partial [Candidatus Eremiobacteraeota bacterium]|nr:hypothetical protein [Candidatus Eremiobacteraeota bacterium]
MDTADIAMARFANRTAAAYTANAPAYMAYRERTHFTIPRYHYEREIDRAIEVRVADDSAIMQDLPQGASRTGQAFPIIPYLDPFSALDVAYFANLKRVDIALKRNPPYIFPLPDADPTVNVVVAYSTFWVPTYAPDSSSTRVHLLISPTQRWPDGLYYPADIVEDAQTHLPAHVVLVQKGSDATATLDFAVLDGHLIVTRGSFVSTQRAGPLALRVSAETEFDQ